MEPNESKFKTVISTTAWPPQETELLLAIKVSSPLPTFSTFTLKKQVAILPPTSVAVYVTVEVPKPNTAPLASLSFGKLYTEEPVELQPIWANVQLSEELTNPIPFMPIGALDCTLTSFGQVIAGAMLSIGITSPGMVSHNTSLPLASVISMATGVCTKATGVAGPPILLK